MAAGLELAKSLVSFREDPRLPKQLGSKYWKRFMSRNWLHVKAKKGVKFDRKRAAW